MKSSVIFVLTLLMILLTTIDTFGQEKNNIEWATDSESLPQNSIKSIAPDKYGFLWMTTENGLVRYDGKEFKVYDSENIGIKNNRFVYIRGNFLTDSLYTTTDYEDDFVFINKRNAKKVDPKNYPEANFNNENADSFVSHGIPSIFFESPKRPYKILLPSKKYYLIAKNQIRFFNSKNQLLFEQKFEYQTNSNFFTIGESLFHVDQAGKYSIISKDKIQNGELDFNPTSERRFYWNIVAQQVFLFDDEKLYLLDYKNEKLKTTLIAQNIDLVSNNVWSIYYSSKDEIVYFGSVKKGLGIYKKKMFSVVTPNKFQNPELYEVFYALERFSDSTIISASGIIMNDKKIIENLHFNSDKYDILIDKEDNIWVSEFRQLFRYKKSNSYKNPDSWQFSDIISTLYLASDGKIWFDLAKNRDKQGSLYFFVPEENPDFVKIIDTNFKINYLTQNDSRFLWIGSKKGLYKLDLVTKKLYLIKNTENLKIRNVYISDANHIWLTTYEKGFFLYKNNKLYSFPLDKNNYLLSAHCIVEDKKGFFWITTNKGLFQVSKKSLLKYSDNKIEQIYYHYYNKKHGFLSNEFNGGCQPCGVSLKNGRIYFPSINGVVSFDPENVLPSLPDNEIFIDEARINGKKINIGNEVNLENDFQRITFYVTTPYFGNQKNLLFEAKLNGPESQKWIEISKENSVSFSNLPPGRYELTIRKLSGFDSNYDYKTVVINVKPAFWETIWFKIFILIAILFLFFISYNLRMAFIKNQNVQLEKIINEKTNHLKNTISTLRATKEDLNQHIENNNKIIQYITHDIKSPLRFMTMASKQMYNSVDDDKDELKEKIKSIYTSSSQMYNFVDNLLEYSKVNLKSENETEFFLLHDIIAKKIALFEGIANSQKTVIKNLIPEKSILNKNKQLFTIIIHNLLDNAVKHTFVGTIVFSTFIQDHQTYLLISDNGHGMSAETLSYYQALTENYDLKTNRSSARMGLQIVMELMLILNGKMTIESKENSGTTIALIFENNAEDLGQKTSS